MKRLVFVTVCAIAIAMGMQMSAIAAEWTDMTNSEWIISPHGEIDVTGQDQVAFDIYFNNNYGWFDAIGFDISLMLDLDELTVHYNPDPPSTPFDPPQYYEVYYTYEDMNGHKFQAASTYNGRFQDFIAPNAFMVAGLSFDDVWIAPGMNHMATAIFDVLNPDAPDGNVDADVYVLANDPKLAKGFMDQDQNVHYVGTDSTINADITAVPIPAAVWLLGSGLLGLIGIRRKTC